MRGFTRSSTPAFWPRPEAPLTPGRSGARLGAFPVVHAVDDQSLPNAEPTDAPDGDGPLAPPGRSHGVRHHDVVGLADDVPDVVPQMTELVEEAGQNVL